VHSAKFISKFTAEKSGQLIQHSHAEFRSQTILNPRSQLVEDRAQGVVYFWGGYKLLAFDMDTGAEVHIA
jgi:hypothetical protein